MSDTNTNPFSNWIEIFRGGKRTDSTGQSRTFSEADIDTIIANHESAPAVVGHPKDTSPAFAWTDGLKRVGLKLYAKFRDVNADFAEAVKNKTYPNRSVSLIADGAGGWKLRHVGWLGGVAPAVRGLEDVAFSSVPDGELVEFAGSWRTAEATSILQSMMRQTRDFFIERFGMEKADAVLPSWQIESLSGMADGLRREAEEPDMPKQSPDFKESDVTEKTLTQKDIDAAVEAAKAEFSQQLEATQTELQKAVAEKRTAEITAHIKRWKQEGKLLPANERGLAEFMADGMTGDVVIEFAAEGGATKKQPMEWFIQFMDAQKPAIKFGKATPDACAVGKAPSTAEVQDYMEKHKCGAADAYYALQQQEQV